MKKDYNDNFLFYNYYLLVVGCSSSKDIQDFNIDKIALDEAKNYIRTRIYFEIRNFIRYLDRDSEVFTLIKEASIKGGI